MISVHVQIRVKTLLTNRPKPNRVCATVFKKNLNLHITFTSYYSSYLICLESQACCGNLWPHIITRLALTCVRFQNFHQTNAKLHQKPHTAISFLFFFFFKKHVRSWSFGTRKNHDCQHVWRHHLNEPRLTLDCHKCLHALKTRDGRGSLSWLYRTIKSIEQKLWETAVGAHGLCFLLAFAWMWGLGVDLMQAIVSTSSAAWVMAFWKQAVFCSGLLGSRVGCHGTASPFWLIGGEGGGAAGRRRRRRRRGVKPVATTAVCYQQEASHSGFVLIRREQREAQLQLPSLLPLMRRRREEGQSLSISQTSIPLARTHKHTHTNTHSTSQPPHFSKHYFPSSHS